MNSTITPIMALNLMSYTEPVIPFENKTITLDEKTSENYNFKSEESNVPCIGICRIIHKIYTTNEKNPKNNVKIPKKFRQKRNNNKYNRKIRNIHQPGRTNCTQRVFK